MADKFFGGVKADTTNVTVYVQLRKAADGLGKTGLVFNSAGLVASYIRQGGIRTAITLATQTTNGAYSSGGFVEMDSTNCPGLYRVDLPDAMFANGVDHVTLVIKPSADLEYVERFVIRQDTLIFAQAATGTLTTTRFTSSLTGFSTDSLIRRMIQFTTGNCKGERVMIVDYVSTNGDVYCAPPLTTAPANADNFVVL